MASSRIGPAGNVYDKFSTSNPVARRLMNGFIETFMSLYTKTDAESIVEVGCGEGHMLNLMVKAAPIRMFGLDLDHEILKIAQRRVPRAAYVYADGHQLPYPDKSIDLTVACEVLEHVSNPAQVVSEIKRITRHYVIASVPREPLWRVLNIMRGKYISELGNTPGHVQHWSTEAFVSMLTRELNVVDVRQPLPWTMVLASVEESEG